MSVLRILLLVMTAGVLAFILYHAVTRQISRDAYLTVIAVACGFSLNLIYLWFSKSGQPPVAIEDRPPVAVEEKAPVVDKANDASPQPNEVSGKPGLTPSCEKELQRTADLLRFFANRVQGGEEIQSVVVDGHGKLLQHLWQIRAARFADGQFSRPVQVVAFNTAEGWSRDVTGILH